MKHLTDQLLHAALVLVLFAFALRWAWSVTQPLLPVLVALLIVWGVARYLLIRRRL